LTFDSFCTSEYTTTFEGNEIIGLYLCLSREEENLDHNQRKALEGLRSLLYANLSVEELEDIGSAYSLHQNGRRIP
jgi:hypothetical protein